MVEEDKFKTYMKIKHMDHEDCKEIFINNEDDICIQEKIDGANARFMIKDGRIIFGSHHCSIGDSTKDIGGNWKRWTDFVKKMYDKNWYKEGYMYYGEAFLKHSIDYDWPNTPPFIGFDIYSFKDEKFLEPREAEKHFLGMNIPFVPIIWEGKVKDIPEINEDFIPMSKFGTVKAEGVVIKNITTGDYTKFVSTKFKEVNRDTFGMSKKYAKDDTERITAMFCTNPRIDKWIFKLLDDGHKLELSLMNFLPIFVMEDIIEEHAQEICRTGYTVNFRQLKKQVTKRCFLTLKQVITNSELNKNG